MPGDGGAKVLSEERHGTELDGIKGEEVMVILCRCELAGPVLIEHQRRGGACGDCQIHGMPVDRRTHLIALATLIPVQRDADVSGLRQRRCEQ